MKSKQLLRFYFSASSLDRALNNLIDMWAFKSVDCSRDGVFYFSKISSLIAAKQELSRLWSYLDCVMDGLKQSDRQTLFYYSGLRRGISSLEPETRRAIKRSVMKFTRHARALDCFAGGVELVGKYYGLVKPTDGNFAARVTTEGSPSGLP